MGNKPDLYDSNERIDQLGYQGLKIIQNPANFKFTIDAFLLAGFINPKPDHRLIDLGTGGGVLPLLLAGQRGVGLVYGLEIQPELAEMARRSVELNGLGDNITIETGDLKNLPVSLKLSSFDYVISNPPFYPVGKGVVSENDSLAMAKFEIGCNLEDVVKAAARLVKANGKVAVIYPTERLNELLLTLNRFHLIPKKLCFVYSKIEAKSHLLLLEARPGAKIGMEVLPPLLIYGENGEYSETMSGIFYGRKLV